MQGAPQLIRVDRRSTARSDKDGPSLAELLNVSNKTAWRIVKRGKVRSAKIEGRRLVHRDSVEAYLASVTTGGEA